MFVMVADDHALVRQGLIEMLKGLHPDWRFAQAGGLDEALEQIAAALPDLLVLDLNMPGMDGGTSLRALREVYPDLRVAVLTGTEDRATILECLDAGVNGYILKSAPPGQLVQAVRTVLEGGVYAPAALTRVAQITAEAASPAARPPVRATVTMPALRPGAADPGITAPLTGRQRDVLALLAEGRSTKDIARVLGLGVGTVKVHLAGVYRALGAHSRMEAVVKAGRVRLAE